MKKAIYIITILLLLVIFGVSAWYVGSYFLEGREQSAKFDELSDIKQSAKAAAQETEATTAPTQGTQAVTETDGERKMLPGYAELYEMNHDLVGWITIDGTEIDYPVMQTPNNTDYYLRRNFSGEDSTRGCIYAREVCDVFRPSDNVTIYGHNMHDGSMFAALHQYQEKSFWEEHDEIQFDNLYEEHVYRIFSVFLTTATLGEGFRYHQMVDAEDEADFDDFIATCKELALYDTGITPKYGDKIICLSTCEKTQENGRLVVAAVRIS